MTPTPSGMKWQRVLGLLAIPIVAYLVLVLKVSFWWIVIGLIGYFLVKDMWKSYQTSNWSRMLWPLVIALVVTYLLFAPDMKPGLILVALLAYVIFKAMWESYMTDDWGKLGLFAALFVLAVILISRIIGNYN